MNVASLFTLGIGEVGKHNKYFLQSKCLHCKKTTQTAHSLVHTCARSVTDRRT
jgi:hypothetical protein